MTLLEILCGIVFEDYPKKSSAIRRKTSGRKYIKVKHKGKGKLYRINKYGEIYEVR